MIALRNAATLDLPPATESVDAQELRFQQRKVAIHERLVDSLNLSAIGEVSRERFADEVRQLAEELTNQQAADLSPEHRRRMVEELIHEIFGLGPLEELTRDPEISDILVNHAHEIYVERRGQLRLADGAGRGEVSAFDANHSTIDGARRTARRRGLAHGRREVAGRLSR